MTLISQITAVPDYAAIKSKQNASWASGDYARIGATLQIVGETLAEDFIGYPMRWLTGGSKVQLSVNDAQDAGR